VHVCLGDLGAWLGTEQTRVGPTRLNRLSLRPKTPVDALGNTLILGDGNKIKHGQTDITIN
jgi:hypothetical protein